jgi:hypothetical protein
MKQNKITPNRRVSAIAVAGTVAVAAVAMALVICYEKLRDIWLEQCIVRDISEQVAVTSGKMVKGDVICGEFGLTNGANLALIDFRRKREEILRKIPNLRTVSVKRRLPDKVVITTEERTPIAQLNLRGRRSATGKVVDSEGVVFSFYRGTSMLPTIYEKNLEASEPGMRLKKRALSALRLLEACRQPEFQDLGVLDVDITKDDYILATLGDYSRVKIAWEGMDDFSPESKIRMTAQLNELAKAIRTRTAPAQMWNATVPGAVALDPKGSNQ